jgi:hypothetical protein
MKHIRKYRKQISLGMLLTLVFQIFAPTVAMANTGNEQQAEFGANGGGGGEMVNMYTGALNYSIPLMSIPGPNIGYNISLSYNSDDAKMMSTPSCVGFGWSLNVGSISRNVQAVPDDFNGGSNNTISNKVHVKPYEMYDLGLGELTSTEYWGLPIDLSKVSPVKEFSYTGHVYWDNYTGLGFRVGISPPSLSLGGGNLGAGLEFDTKRGLGYHLSAGYGNVSTSVSGNMLTGLHGFSLGVNDYASGSIGVVFNQKIPFTQMAMNTTVTSGSLKLGIWGFPKGAPTNVPGENFISKIETGEFRPYINYYNNKNILGSFKFDVVKSSVDKGSYDSKPYGYLYKALAPSDNSNIYVKDFIKYPLEYSKGTMFLPASQLGADVFIQSDQGSGGVFTAREKNFETWSSAGVYSKTSTLRIGGEFGKSGGTDFNVGVDVLAGIGTNYSGSPIEYQWGAANLINPNVNSSPNNHFLSGGLKNTSENDGRIPLIKSSEIQIERNPVLPGLGEDEPRRMGLNKSGNYFTGDQRYSLSGTLENADQSNSSYNRARADDFKQHSYVQYLTTREFLDYGRSKGMNYHTKLSNDGNLQTQRAGHIAEINVFETNGMIYTYSEPVYNMKREDAMFSLQYNADSGLEGLELNQHEVKMPDANRTSDGQATYGRARFVNGVHSGMELLNVTSVPGYATSWPVTMITSSDYVDVDQSAGPSDGDIGSWVKFTYETTHGGTDARGNALPLYKWRAPYNKVNTSDPIKGESGDDLGSYRYGEKEVKYVTQIETNTHIAKFEYEDREDAYPVKNKLGDESGNNLNRDDANGNPLKRLKSIKLYLKRADLSPSSADYLTLLQTVNLTHDYSLCQNSPDNKNNSGTGGSTTGKLTLKSIYSTFMHSIKGENYVYNFDYGNTSDKKTNPDYNTANLDRWGDFKLNKTDATTFKSNNYPFQDFAYTEDNLSVVAPWCLRSVELPTGAKMTFEFEARDYAYVEDQEATKMYDIVSVKSGGDIQSGGDISHDTLRNLNSLGDRNEDYLGHQDHVAIKLPTTDKNGNAWTYNAFYHAFVEGIDNEVYMKAYVHLNKYKSNLSDRNEKDYDFIEVMGMLSQADSTSCEVVTKAGVTYGVIHMKKVNPQGLNPFPSHPIRAAAFEHLKQKRSEIFMGRVSDGFGANVATSINLLYASINQGFTSVFLQEEYADAIRFNGWSKIRLKDPNCAKKGGGYRIKTITLDDNWRGANSTDSYYYKQAYEYTMVEDGIVKSSGVAMEPLPGREEDPRYKLFYYEENIPSLESNKRFNAGNPLDMHNASASVGYRKVVVKNVYPTTINPNNIQLSIAPHTEYVFNTPREYPTIVKFTQVSDQYNQMNYPISINEIFSINLYDNAVSQGHTVVKNDMAGKLKSITQYTRTGSVISSQEYEYFQDVKATTDYSYKADFEMTANAKTVDHLSNAGINTINSGIADSTMKMRVENTLRVGEDYNMWMEVNDNHEEMDEIGFVQFGLGFNFTPPYLLYIMPLVFVPQNFSNKSDKQVVVTKIIDRRGILKQVKTQKDQSKIRTEYLAYDQETASPLLTRVDNEWHNINAQVEDIDVTSKEPRIYKFTRPAYWEYNYNYLNASTKVSTPFLGAYKTIDKTFYKVNLSSAGKVLTLQEKYAAFSPIIQNPTLGLFAEGDKVVYYASASSTNPLIGYITKDTVTGDYYLHDELFSFVATGDIYNLRVLRSGNTNLVNTTVGEIVFKNLNLHIGDGVPFAASDYLNVSAITFNSQWPKYCCYGSTSTLLNNPYISGEKNRWLPYQSFVYHDTRLYTGLSYSQRGLINPLGLPTGITLMNSFNWQRNSGFNWVLSSQAIRYDLFGNLLEQKDALGLSSTSYFGYGKLRAIGVASNSTRSESGLENFEQNGYDNCGNTGNLGLSDGIIGNTDSQISEDKSHTGKYSLKVLPANAD